MKTDDLIAMLGTNVEPVDRKYVLRAVGAAIAVSTLIAAATILVAFGFRTDLTTTRAFIFLFSKLAFTMVTFVLTAIMLTKLARPGTAVIPIGMHVPVNVLQPGSYRVELQASNGTGKLVTRSADIEVE